MAEKKKKDFTRYRGFRYFLPGSQIFIDGNTIHLRQKFILVY